LSTAVQEARPMLWYQGLIGSGKVRSRRPTEDELDRIRAHLAPQYLPVMEFLIITGMRRGEALRIAWEDLDYDKKMVLIRDRKHPRTKKGNHEWIPLLGASWMIATSQPREEGEDRIFPIEPHTLSVAFGLTCKALKIADLRVHDLRHEGISRMFEQGYSTQQVALVSGHKNWNMLRKYTNLKPQDLHHGPGPSRPVGAGTSPQRQNPPSAVSHQRTCEPETSRRPTDS